MIKWYSDKDMAIFFSKTPNVDFRVIEPEMSAKEKKEIAEKPFLNKEDVVVVLFDLRRNARYSFSAKKGYVWDGATIPRIAWRVIGAKTDPRFLVPSLIHDLLCENHNFAGNDRYFADKVFERLLYVSGVSAVKRWAMFHSVDNFQKFQGWKV